jgi:hypothetical protein
MDSELIIYLIFLAIFIVSRLLKKPKDTPTSGPVDTSRRPSRPTKSFEEMLEEFTQGPLREGQEKAEEIQQEAKEKAEAFREDSRYETEDSRRLKEEARYRGETPVYRERLLDTSYKGYEGMSGDELRTLDEMVEIENIRTKSILKAEEEEEEGKIELHTIRDILNDPMEARKAIILSEIIPRRY